ncbi:MAG: hypothetical protein ACRC0V_08610 [Fusobacteriaceae bacterium]
MRKKIGLSLLFLGVLLNAQDEGVMQIKAQVIKPLRVEVIRDIDFGKVIAGSFTRLDGEFRVSGEPGELYLAHIKELGKSEGEGTIEMVNKNDSSIKFPVLAWTDLFYGGDMDTIKLNKEGIANHTVGIDLTVPATQTPGEYSTQLTMVVRYQ